LTAIQRWVIDTLRKHVVNPLGERKHPNWETPDLLFKICHAEFHFNLDVCANEKNHKVIPWLGPGGTIEDGLEANWMGHTCWMNPPFDNIHKWMEKAHYEWSRGDGHTLVVALVPASTETKWFIDFATKAFEIRYLTPRVPFIDEHGVAMAGNPHPSCLVIFRGNLYGFPVKTIYNWRWQ